MFSVILLIIRYNFAECVFDCLIGFGELTPKAFHILCWSVVSSDTILAFPLRSDVFPLKLIFWGFLPFIMTLF